MAEALRAEHGLVSCDLHVLPHGLCPSAPTVGSTRQPVVLAAGRWRDGAKNLGRLAAVAPCVRGPVCIAGPMRGRALFMTAARMADACIDLYGDLATGSRVTPRPSVRGQASRRRPCGERGLGGASTRSIAR